MVGNHLNIPLVIVKRKDAQKCQRNLYISGVCFDVTKSVGWTTYISNREFEVLKQFINFSYLFNTSDVNGSMQVSENLYSRTF